MFKMLDTYKLVFSLLPCECVGYTFINNANIAGLELKEKAKLSPTSCDSVYNGSTTISRNYNSRKRRFPETKQYQNR